jgi:hypothetical protein
MGPPHDPDRMGRRVGEHVLRGDGAHPGQEQEGEERQANGRLADRHGEYPGSAAAIRT